ncbi:hypothetical protein V6Z93_002382 [Aspergillus fumigatus]
MAPLASSPFNTRQKEGTCPADRRGSWNGQGRYLNGLHKRFFKYQVTPAGVGADSKLGPFSASHPLPIPSPSTVISPFSIIQPSPDLRPQDGDKTGSGSESC